MSNVIANVFAFVVLLCVLTLLSPLFFAMVGIAYLITGQ
jgi:hypothetical protein